MLRCGAAMAALILAANQSVPPPKLPQTAGEALHAAVRAGKFGEVKRLIGEGTPVDARDATGSTPLLDAAWAGYTDIAAFLLERGAEVNARQGDGGATALEYAVRAGRAEMVRLLLAGGARPGGDVLHMAAARGNTAVVELLLEAKADVEALDANGNTALDSAVLHGRKEAMEALLRHGADAKRVHALDGRGALDEACQRGFAELIPPLIDAGAQVGARDRFGQTPLDIALAYRNGGVVAALLRLGLKESQRIAEETMEGASLRGQTEIARLLLENGLAVNRPAGNGASYLNDAALKGQKKMVELLLEHGARVEARNESGGTALHDAALGGSAEVAALLLDKGAGIDERERETGATALMMAASLGRVEVVRLLLKRGANAGLRDQAGHTALERARAAGNDEIVKLLEGR